jgi:hypothetical protein
LYNSPTYDEKELLLQVAEGDETAFRQLYLQWHQFWNDKMYLYPLPTDQLTLNPKLAPQNAGW